MSFVKLNWTPNKKELRQFGAVFLVGFLAIGCLKYFWPWAWLFTRNERLGLILITIGLLVGLIALSGSRAALPLYYGWLGIAYVFGNVIGRILFGALFFAVVTPLGILGRLIRRDRLQLKKTTRRSYWHTISLPDEVEQYERQF